MSVPQEYSLSAELWTLTRRVGAVGLGRSIDAGIRLAITIALANLLTRELFGGYQQAWLILSALSPLFLLGFPASLFYFLPRLEGEPKSSLLRGTVLFLLLSGAALGIFLFSFASPIARAFNSPILPGCLRYFSIYCWSSIAFGFVDPFLISERRIRLQLAISLSHSAALLASVIPPVLFGGGLIPAFRMLAILGLLKLVAVIVFLIASGDGRVLDPDLFRRQALYAIPIGISAAVGILTLWLDKMIISLYFRDPGLFAIYSVGAMEIPFVGILLGSVSSVIMPELSRLHHGGRTAELLKLWHESMVRVGMAVFPTFVFGMIFAGRIMETVFSERYLGAAAPFRIYLLMLPLRVAFYGPVLMALGRPRLVLWGALGDLTGNLVLSLMLVRTVGFLGPAISTALMTYVHVAFLIYMIASILGVTASEVMPWGRLLRPAAMAAASGCISLPALFIPGWSGTSLILGAIVFSAVFLSLIRRFGPTAGVDR